ncbi:MAG: ABC transporter substrate-binding protein [Cellulomonas sp.]|nr:ABC transporter substrate-binding protein [Cellulomonas sp.]
MNTSITRVGFALVAAATMALAACSTGGGASPSSSAAAGGLPALAHQDSYTIGFSAQQSDHPWTIAFNNSIEDEAKARGHKIVVTDAQGSTAKQVSDVESLIAQGVDVIIISPREEKPLAEVTLKAKAAGIPVFIVDRAVDKTVAVAGEDYVSYIGSDFYAEGKAAGEWLVTKLGGTGTVIEIAGTTGSSAADDRGSGFREALEGSNVEIVASQDGNFVRDTGRQAMEALIQQNSDADAVFAHNDEMALGSITALQAAGITPGEQITVVSVDGQKEALQAIIDGTLGATVECNPRFGPAVMDAIEAYGNGETVETSIINKDNFYDSSNAAAQIANAY